MMLTEATDVNIYQLKVLYIFEGFVFSELGWFKLC